MSSLSNSKSGRVGVNAIRDNAIINVPIFRQV